MANQDFTNIPYEFEEEERFSSVLSNLKDTLDTLSNDSATNKVVDANQESEIAAISGSTASGVSKEYVDDALSKKVDKVDGQSLIASGVAEALDLDAENNIESQTAIVVDNYITCEDASGNTHNVGNELVEISALTSSKQDKLEGTIKIVGDGMEFISNEGNIKIGTEGDFQGISLNEGTLLLTGSHVEIDSDNNNEEVIINGVKFSSLENTANKVSSVTSASTDSEYPSAKAVYDAINATSKSISGDDYITVEDSGLTTEIKANVVSFADAVVSAHTITSMTMAQRGETGDITFIRNESNDETHDDGEFYAWNYSGESSISAELYYTKEYPELNVYDDIYVYSGTPIQFMPMRNESGESMFMATEYSSIDIEKVDGLASIADLKGVIGSEGEFNGLTITDGTTTLNMEYIPDHNMTKDGTYYYAFTYVVEGIKFIVDMKSIDNIKPLDVVTIYGFVDQQDNEEAKAALSEDSSTDVTILKISGTSNTGLYKYINEKVNAVEVDAIGDAYVNLNADYRSLSLATHVVNIAAADGQIDCMLLKYSYLDTSDEKTKSVYGDWVRIDSKDESNYYAWHMRLSDTVDESNTFYTKVLPSDAMINKSIDFYQKTSGGTFVDFPNVKDAVILALNNPLILGTYSNTGACMVDKSYGIKIGSKFSYWPFYTMNDPIKEGDYYCWHGLWSTNEVLWYSLDAPTEKGQVIDMYYKEDGEIKLNSECTYTVTGLTTYSDYTKDGLARAYDVKKNIESATTELEDKIEALEARIKVYEDEAEKQLTVWTLEDGTEYKEKIIGTITTNNAFITTTSPAVAVKVGNTVTKIGHDAFYGSWSPNSALTSVKLAEGVVTIGDEAFAFGKNISSVTLSNSLETIGNSAFYDCTSLTSIAIPVELYEIQKMAFQNCTSLSGVSLNTNLHIIGSQAFYGCSNLSNINFLSASRLESIGENAFCNTNITKVALPQNMSYLGNNSFSGCKNLSSVTMNCNSLLEIGNSAFMGDENITSLTLPPNLKTIGNYAFQNCSGITSIELPSSVTEINNYAFAVCSSISTITLSDNLQTIGEGAFYKSGISSVTYQGKSYDSISALTTALTDNGVTVGTSAFASTKLNA